MLPITETTGRVTWHFRYFPFGTQIYHIIVYLTLQPQPNRALASFVEYGITFSMTSRLHRFSCK
uniref:Uncharacterized protein n=1 Tax=Spermophilus dauricus TaxID=99837 RepID=A0A8C9PWY3_SPEDA